MRDRRKAFEHQGDREPVCSLIRDNARFVVVAVCSAVFVMILEDVLELESMRLDRAAYWLIV